MSKTVSLTQGSVTGSLLKFTVPVLLALLLQTMYGTVDMIIVGNFSTVNDISAVTVGSQIMNTLTSLCTGLAMGTTILLGQKIGEEKHDEAGYVVSNSIYIFMALSFLIMGLLLVFRNNVVSFMNTPETAITQTDDYLFYTTLGIPMIFSYNILGSVFRGIGDSRTPLLAVFIACAVNIIGDLICVKNLSMGAGGAAIATVIAQTVSVVFSIIIIAFRGNLPFNFGRKYLKYRSDLIKRVLILGAPIALESILVSFSFLCITAIVNQFGVISSAAVGLSEKISSLIMLVPISFMQSIAVFVAQNYGAKNLRRAKKGMKVAIIISFAFGLITGLLTFFKGEMIASLYTSDTAVLMATKEYLKAYAIDCASVPFMFCLTGYFNGCGKTTFVMVQGLVGSVFMRIPLAYALSRVVPTSLFIIGLATPISSMVQNVLCVIYFIYLNKKFSKDPLLNSSIEAIKV